MNVTNRHVIDGVSSGDIIVDGSGGELIISGVHEGPVTIESLGTVSVTGDLVGPVEIRVAGTLVIEASGRISGNVKNFGSFTNRGLRAGLVEGRTPDDQDGSVHVEAEHVGGATYRLPPRD